ncbi:M20/M25/M40 family metallo-hydrolase [Thermocaproicibacter melissae]|uniref:M20/M25/M40 family metallo-hydrolase n=1 Tax=Thermocaproicibacter melissae TaxID=2966552 RepID=UPI0024B27B97|nr:M20/M25/M40 family metallo-hydrolase [Thermocaproicibacter melissae]WBY63821.1 M20/M25/M40 family metallo-hydrolase [Thermocaproicibacter melissae]
MLQNLKEMLFRLCGAAGTPGDESEVRAVVQREFAPYAKTGTDALGNLTAEIGSKDAKTHLLIDAHLDQIGLIVTRIDDKGFLHVDRCGGTDRRVMPGTAVTVLGKKPLCGVVCCMPPHLTGGKEEEIPEIAEMTVDLGCDAETVKSLVHPGDRIVFRTEPKELLGGRVSAPGLDNRASIAVMVRCAQMLADEPLRCRVTFLCSTREEVGGQGAVTGAYLADPTQAIAVDVGFAMQPGVRPEQCGKLGGGPMIGFAPVLDRTMSERLVAIAEREKIPYKRDVMGGETGTNSDAIAVTKTGVPTALISVPERNMHTPAEIIDLRDIEATARLIAAYVREVE